jgi:polar amino acid transport system permease protein
MAAPVLAARGLVPAALPREWLTAAHALDLALEPGTICCLVGPQGGGKTAWLRALAAVEPLATGDLSIAGSYCAGLAYETWRRLRPRIAYIGESAPLLSVLNGLANVTLPAHYHRLGSTEAIRAKALGILEAVGWHGPLDVLPAYLDEHQRRLLALARCLILDPQILFIDEPFRMTDVAGWHHMGSVFVSLARERRLTQVIVTHHLPFVRRHADRVLFISRAGVREYAGWAAFAGADDPAVPAFLESTGVAFAGAR